MKGLKIRKDITCSELVSILHERLNIDPYLFDIHIKCCYNLLVQVPPIDIVDDEDLNFFLEGSDALGCHCLYHLHLTRGMEYMTYT